MKTIRRLLIVMSITIHCQSSFSQQIVTEYQQAISDSLQTGVGDKDYMPYIQSGYTLMLPSDNEVKGVLIFLEDSGYDQKNKSAKTLYEQANNSRFAVLSVSTELPFDFYLTSSSITSASELIKKAFTTHNLPNTNVFFLGPSLTGHRAMQYIKAMKQRSDLFYLNITGIVICDFTLDWTRKWNQHRRDIRIDKINLWEPRFINYMLEKHLGGSPKTNPDTYHEFSPYSFFDKENRNIKLYSEYPLRAYSKPDIEYRLNNQYRTLYENNLTDIVGFLAELRLAGNDRTDLIIFNPQDIKPQKFKQSTWDLIDKQELMEWILSQKQNE